MPDITLENVVRDVVVDGRNLQEVVIDAFEAVGGASFRLEIDKHNPDPNIELRSEWSKVIAERGGGENLKEYGERILRELGLMVVHAYDKFIDERDRYRPAVAAIVPPNSDVDDGAIV